MKPALLHVYFPALLLAAPITFGFAHAETHYVSKTGSDTPPYTSWETAAASIQFAIDAASEGDTVLVATGTYDRRITMKSGITLAGSGPGDTAIQTGLGVGVTFIGVTRSSIEGFCVGVPPGSHGSDRGIWVEDSRAVTIRNCAIKGHRNSTLSGEGIRVLRSQLTIRDCTIEENECFGSYEEPSEEAGGGLHAIASEVTIENCVVRNNRAGTGGGGGIFLGCSGLPCRIRNSEIIQNRAADGPGGGIVFYGTGEITGCVVARNGGGLDGGGIWCGGTVAIRDCIISNNVSGVEYGYQGGGGGIYHMGGAGSAVLNCVIASNSAPRGYGGGIYWHAEPNVIDSTIVENSASVSEVGSAIFVEYPADIYGMHENIINCVILNNGYYAALQGCQTKYSAIQGKYDWEGEGNIYVHADTFSAIELPEVLSVRFDDAENATKFTLKEPFGGENQYRHMFAKVRYADSQGDWKDHSSFLIAGNAGSELRCYGRATPSSYTVLSLAVTDFTLSDDSPCIDAGNNEAEYLPDVDKAGNFRIWRGRDEWRVDMGAYEYGSRRFQVAAVAPTAEPGHLKLTWNSQLLPAKTYSVYLSPDLATWTLAGSNIPSQGETTSWVDPVADLFSSRFYRISSP